MSNQCGSHDAIHAGLSSGGFVLVLLLMEHVTEVVVESCDAHALLLNGA